MKKKALTLIALVVFQFSFAQNGEFEIQENGLIYGESTMNQLKTIVDSLNLKFRACDINKSYHSKYQSIGHKIKIFKKGVKNAKRDIENNISFEEFKTKHPQAEVSENVLIVYFNYTNSRGNNVTKFNEISLSSDYGTTLWFNGNLKKHKRENVSEWVFEYHKKTSYSEEALTAFYFPNKLESQELPLQYSQMISYADCLIDTTVNKMKDDLNTASVELPKNWKSKSKEQQEKLLDDLRSTRVVGSCSMDNRPRRHAVNIAMVSAETQNWEVFLRAHLDVMNDRFDRATDGSYAWAQRKTYIKELEELDIDVLDLVLGISLRVENSAKNHYYGSIRRVGRALAETNNKTEVENQLFSIIEDQELDMYNRVLGYYLLHNYTYNQVEEAEMDRLKAKIKESVSTFPEGLAQQIELD